LKHLHEILTPKEKTEWCIYVNRHVNVCKNIKIIKEYIQKLRDKKNK